MKLIRNAIAAGAVAAVALAACSSEHGSTGSSTGANGGVNPAALGGQGGDTGNVDMRLSIGTGVNLFSLNYTCTGPSTIPPGTVNFGDAQSIEFVLGGVVAGTGYTCSFTGTDSSGDPCTGSSTFSVSAGTVSGGGLNIVCTAPSDASVAADVNTGSVGFDASYQLNSQGSFSCPAINSFSIIPSEVLGSQPAQLGLSETGPIGLAADGGATSSDIVWTASCATPPCGNFLGADGGLSPDSTNPVFVCGPNAEQVTITAQVTDYQTNIATGVTSDVCAGKLFTTISATIDCEGGGSVSCFAPTNTVCSGACTNTNNAPVDPANCGACGATCSGATPVCQHNASTNTNSCVPTPPGGPCVQIVAGAPADATGNANCVKCDQNTNNVCTATEAIVVARDIEKGLVTGTTPNASTGPGIGSCYECEVNAFCLNSAAGASGKECDSLTGASVQECLDTLNCATGSPQTTPAGSTATDSASATAASVSADCSNSADGVFNCFCGSAEPDVTDCKTADSVSKATPPGTLGTSSPNGVCASLIIAGTGTTTATSNTTIITDMSSLTLGAGKALKIPQCAGSNQTTGQACTQCYE